MFPNVKLILMCVFFSLKSLLGFYYILLSIFTTVPAESLKHCVDSYYNHAQPQSLFCQILYINELFYFHAPLFLIEMQFIIHNLLLFFLHHDYWLCSRFYRLPTSLASVKQPQLTETTAQRKHSVQQLNLKKLSTSHTAVNLYACLSFPLNTPWKVYIHY